MLCSLRELSWFIELRIVCIIYKLLLTLIFKQCEVFDAINHLLIGAFMVHKSN